jgi:hypothetical protein
MTDQPTPETDAIFTDNVPEDAQIVAFCERLERERDAARAERDTANALSLSLCADRDGDAKDRDDEIAVLRADVARLSTALEAMLIAEMELRQMDGFSADEAETEPHWMAARAALAQLSK